MWTQEQRNERKRLRQEVEDWNKQVHAEERAGIERRYPKPPKPYQYLPQFRVLPGQRILFKTGERRKAAIRMDSYDPSRGFVLLPRKIDVYWNAVTAMWEEE